MKSETNVISWKSTNKKKVIFPGFQGVITKKRGVTLVFLLAAIIFETLSTHQG